MIVFKPEQILKALAGGPKTYRMIAAALGCTTNERPEGWWQRFWWKHNAEGWAMTASLRAMLSDMVAVGQIVHAPGPPETWALPPEKKPVAPVTPGAPGA